MNSKDTAFRDLLLSGLEPSDDLRERFKRLVGQLMRGR